MDHHPLVDLGPLIHLVTSNTTPTASAHVLPTAGVKTCQGAEYIKHLLHRQVLARYLVVRHSPEVRPGVDAFRTETDCLRRPPRGRAPRESELSAVQRTADISGNQAGEPGGGAQTPGHWGRSMHPTPVEAPGAEHLPFVTVSHSGNPGTSAGNRSSDGRT